MSQDVCIALKTKGKALAVASYIFFAVLPGFAFAQEANPHIPSVDELLETASRALQEQSYRGRFTYEFGTTLETLEIVHLVRDGVEYERITHLNGVEREFLRGGRDQNCVSTGGFLLRGGLIPQATGAVSLSQSYHFYIRGRDRIAGRDAELVQAVPKDEYRYGMTLAVDRRSGLPLMSLITVSNKGAIERFQFTELEVGPDIEAGAISPTAAQHARLDGESLPCSKLPTGKSIWRAGWLPPGFVVSHITSDAEGDALTYTDGIASFTLFIKPLSDPSSFKQGMARRGATTALMAVVPAFPHSVGVVLVGEVPFATAQQVVTAVTTSSGAR
jgi:sigma-E factor negative regulatory protein RseB